MILTLRIIHTRCNFHEKIIKSCKKVDYIIVRKNMIWKIYVTDLVSEILDILWEMFCTLKYIEMYRKLYLFCRIWCHKIKNIHEKCTIFGYLSECVKLYWNRQKKWGVTKLILEIWCILYWKLLKHNFPPKLWSPWAITLDSFSIEGGVWKSYHTLFLWFKSLNYIIINNLILLFQVIWVVLQTNLGLNLIFSVCNIYVCPGCPTFSND